MAARRVQAVTLQVVRRQVVAAAHHVDAHVLPEVDQLQRGADRVAALLRCAVVDAIKVQQQAADRIGTAPAVVQQFGPVGIAGGVAALVHVLFEGGQQVGQGAQRQLEVAHRAAQGNEDAGPAAAVGAAAEAGVEVCAVGGEVGQALCRVGRAFVGDVVGSASKAVDRGNRRPQARGAKPGGDGEIFVVVDPLGRHAQARVHRAIVA